LRSTRRGRHRERSTRGGRTRTVSDEYDLQIERTGNLYDVTWLVDGSISAVGVGMEVGDRLAVGWRRVDG